jgi:hypothetical protein
MAGTKPADIRERAQIAGYRPEGVPLGGGRKEHLSGTVRIGTPAKVRRTQTFQQIKTQSKNQIRTVSSGANASACNRLRTRPPTEAALQGWPVLWRLVSLHQRTFSLQGGLHPHGGKTEVRCFLFLGLCIGSPPHSLFRILSAFIGLRHGRLQTAGPCGACIHLSAAVCAKLHTRGQRCEITSMKRKTSGSKLGQSQIEIRTKASELGQYAPRAVLAQKEASTHRGGTVRIRTPAKGT